MIVSKPVQSSVPQHMEETFGLTLLGTSDATSKVLQTEEQILQAVFLGINTAELFQDQVQVQV